MILSADASNFIERSICQTIFNSRPNIFSISNRKASTQIADQRRVLRGFSARYLMNLKHTFVELESIKSGCEMIRTCLRGQNRKKQILRPKIRPKMGVCTTFEALIFIFSFQNLHNYCLKHEKYATFKILEITLFCTAIFSKTKQQNLDIS